MVICKDNRPTKDGEIWFYKTKHVDIDGTHKAKKSCASLLVNKGANAQVVAKYLGHTKIEETLKTYSHLFTSL